MRLPIGWLREFVSVTLGPEELASRLTRIGLEVEGILEIEGEKVLEISVPPNRGDLLSIRGLAREVAALLGRPLRQSARKEGFSTSGRVGEGLQVDLRDSKRCPRYSVRVIRRLNVGPSPEWIVRRLTQSGLRSVNNVVDVTNYVLLELGQPLHAFDLAKLRAAGEKKKIVIRGGVEGESLKTLDGEERELCGGDLLIADEEGPIAVGGVMGGEGSEVSEETEVVALESAFFEPRVIRRTARRLGVSTESSVRFERGIDSKGVVEALSRASGLLAEVAGGVPTQDWIDRYPKRERGHRIEFQPAEVEGCLGGRWPASLVQKQLKQLGVVPGGGKKKNPVWQIPSYRRDLREGVDLVEEVARLSGLEKIPLTLPSILPSASARKDQRLQEATRWVRGKMVHLGFFEAIHSSFVSPADLEWDPRFGASAVSLTNPLGLEGSYLRPSLLISLLKTLAMHHQHQIFDVRLFELRKIFTREANARVRETLMLSAVASGAPLASQWGEREAPVDLFEMKGVVEAIARQWGLSVRFDRAKTPLLLPGKSSSVLLEGEELGILGELHPALAERLEIKRGVLLFEISWERFLKRIPPLAVFRRYSRVPLTERDLSIIVDQEIPAGEIEAFLKGQDQGILRHVKIFDRYQGEQIAKGKKSLSFSLVLGREDRTLTEEEVNEFLRRVVESVRREYHAETR